MIETEMEIDAGDGQWVAHRDQRPGLLGRHDPTNLGNGEHIAFLHRTALHELQSLRAHHDPTPGGRLSGRIVLSRYVDHVCSARLIKMGKSQSACLITLHPSR